MICRKLALTPQNLEILKKRLETVRFSAAELAAKYAASKGLPLMYAPYLQSWFGIHRNSHPDLQTDITNLQSRFQAVKQQISPH